LGNILPATEHVTFNPDNNQIKWQSGQIAPGTGFAGIPKILSFQISLLPSVSQVGTAPVLLGPSTITGTDNFNGATLTSVNPAITTRTTNDPNFKNGIDQVTQ
jgi:hypothetical protein